MKPKWAVVVREPGENNTYPVKRKKYYGKESTIEIKNYTKKNMMYVPISWLYKILHTEKSNMKNNIHKY